LLLKKGRLISNRFLIFQELIKSCYRHLFIKGGFKIGNEELDLIVFLNLDGEDEFDPNTYSRNLPPFLRVGKIGRMWGAG